MAGTRSALRRPLALAREDISTPRKDRLEIRQRGIWGVPMKPMQTERASRLVRIQPSTANESAPKRPRARFTSEPVTTSRPSSRIVSWMARDRPEATCTVRSAPETGRPSVIQARTASSTRPMRTRMRRLVTKEP